MDKDLRFAVDVLFLFLGILVGAYFQWLRRR